jgi:hypothetical protein
VDPAQFDQAMKVGAARYGTVIETLNNSGLPTTFTQTGGMCAALEIRLETGGHLLITDAEDSLSWNRDEQHGWGVGLYRAESEYDDGPLAFAESDDRSIESLFVLVREVLGVPRGPSSRITKAPHAP